MRSVVAFGELALALEPEPAAPLLEADFFRARYTGPEARTAVALAHLGHDVHMVSRCPTHAIGQAAVNTLRRYGVHTEGIVRAGNRLAVVYREMPAHNQTDRAIADVAHSGFLEARSEEFDWSALLAGKHWFHFSASAAVAGGYLLAILMDGLRTANQFGLKVSCDCAFGSLPAPAEESGRVLTALMEYVDVFLGDAEDAERLLGVRIERDARAMELYLPEAAERLRRRFEFESVAVTVAQPLGAGPRPLECVLCDADGCYVDRGRQLPLRESRGTREAFAAGLLHGLLSGAEPQHAIEFAGAAWALKHCTPGEFGLASVEELLAFQPGTPASE